MPRVSITPAFSAWPSKGQAYLYDVPEKCTALTIKRLAGHDTTSWLYVRLPRHKYDEKCDCYSCSHYKAGWWDRPAWVSKSEFRATWHRWTRANIGARNVRLAIKGGELFTVVAEIDMPLWAELLAESGRHGQIIALEWYLRKRAA